MLIDNNLAETFLRSALCNPFVREKRLKCDFGGVGKTKGGTCAFVTIAQASAAFFHHCSSLPSRSTYNVGQPPPPKTLYSKTKPIRPRPFPPSFSSSEWERVVAQDAWPCFVLFSPLFVFNCCDGGQLISIPPPNTLSAPHTAVAWCVC